MRNWIVVAVLTSFVVGLIIVCGCVGSSSSSQSTTSQSISPTQIPVSTPKVSTPIDCIIDESQTGKIEILDYHFDPAPPSMRMVGKAKNVGTNTISGTIENTEYLDENNNHRTDENDKILRRSVYKFCNIEPNQEFEYRLENVEPTKAESYMEGCCLNTLNAGQKIVTTGKKIPR